MSAWHEGSRAEALAIWGAVAQNALRYANADLLHAMHATGTLNHLLLGMQAALRSREGPSDSEAVALKHLLSIADEVPLALQKSMLSEWQGTEVSLKGLSGTMQPPSSSNIDSMGFALTGLIVKAAYDPSDSINRQAVNFKCQRKNVLLATQGEVQNEERPSAPCAWAKVAAPLCFAYMRNPFGTRLQGSPPEYLAYGTRVADMRILAAATRIAIEAKRLRA